MTEQFCEFYSPINLVSSFGSTPVSKSMRSTMQLFHHVPSGKGYIEWVVWYADGSDAYVEEIGCWWDAETMQFDQYDGVFDIPREAIELLRCNGIIFDPVIWSDELAYPLSKTFKLISEI